ncbi:GNAT family N-acetyltransferase [Brevibacterium jeotgali]|uniref:Acetyltransferase (GNAT) family protein n=1 Tax=Brevibacterium jeotgali TaxID=1262550 RepID=A0A2H1L7I6_9MICO|nr:GNAT family N-acetyltransferase [Brevibacterium jeotgali]TWC03439.1 acetyltransferase (GNAT) family protein [Brevibacterium jeotgali]SMY12868.1 Acetyltransferase (GNAT) family protein [Brevibacterium jeotgali]
MHTPRFTTRTAGPDDLAIVLELSLEAFVDEAVLAWAMPDPADREAHMRKSFSASLAAAIGIGAVLLAFDRDGTAVAVSIWVPRDGAGQEAGAEEEAGADEWTDDPVQRRLAIVEAATEARVPDQAHLHLSAMATRPQSRGLGAGTVLLDAGLDHARSRGLPLYLEASDDDNRRLYARRGFRDLGDGIVLPEQGPVLQPMWREHDGVR